MRITLCLLLILLLQHSGHAESPNEKTRPAEISQRQPGKNSPPHKPSATKPTPPGPALRPAPGPALRPAPQPHKKTPPKWLSLECLRENYTHLSCSKVFCPPWRRCISGKCVCKLPYQCPRIGDPVCGLDKKTYMTYCQAQAAACRSNTPVFSHYGLNCNEHFEVSLKQSGAFEVVQVKTTKGRALVCGTKSWNIAAANVVCRHQKEDARGAVAPKKVKSKDLGDHVKLPQCISVKCTGSELSLAECTLYEPQTVEDSTEVAAVNCYNKHKGQEVCSEFTCVNQKCILWKHTCDGMDHCGDNSDEMCCNSCQKGFYCKPGVCIPPYAVQDSIRDCLGGEDEIPGARPNKATTESDAESYVKPEKDSPAEVKPDEDSPAEVKPDEDSPAEVKPEPDSHAEPERGPPVNETTVTGSEVEAEVTPETGDSPAEVKPVKDLDSDDPYEKKPVWSNPKDDIQKVREHIDTQLQCGIPNMDYVYRTEGSQSSRRKRVVGGAEALPTQIQWQVAVQDEGSIHCGGVYLGGCWVLTAAHCVRPKPRSFHIKFSLWKKYTKQSTSDIIPVKNIIIHKDYDSRTYQNDIALVQLEELANEKECLCPNPAVRSVCVPWSTLQFQPGDTCTISGWGRNKEGRSAEALKWANVTIIGDCKKYYKDKLFEGMECAGDLDGRVDSCQGDSGGPLVCKDASGLSYVWGIVSWGEKCGEADNPGVYTKVAHYFEWIRFHTGWPAVTKYNH